MEQILQLLLEGVGVEKVVIVGHFAQFPFRWWGSSNSAEPGASFNFGRRRNTTLLLGPTATNTRHKARKVGASRCRRHAWAAAAAAAAIGHAWTGSYNSNPGHAWAAAAAATWAATWAAAASKADAW